MPVNDAIAQAHLRKHPEASWSLEELAQSAGMPAHVSMLIFRPVVGMTPFDYLTDWQLGVAQTMLPRGNSLKTDRGRSRVCKCYSSNASLYPADRNVSF
jgi:AraC-like DNA-binding protein